VTNPTLSARRTHARRAQEYRFVYLWHWPIRAMHWTAAACMLVLIVTGFYIGRPYFTTSGEAIDHFMMGRVRLAHFVAAGLLVGTGIVRIYWLLAGSKYENWKALFPASPRALRGLVEMAKYYLMLPRARHLHYLGHNPLQQVTYTAVYVLVAFQVVTGFALFSLANPGGLLYQLSGWTAWVPGGIRDVRFAHHVVTWLLVTFIPIHVYLGIRADVIDREGTLSSIFNGGRWVPEAEKFEDE